MPKKMTSKQSDKIVKSDNRKVILSKKQITKIQEALRLYDRKRETVEVTLSQVRRRKITETDKYNRAIRRYTNAFQSDDDRRSNWSVWSRKKKDGTLLMPRSIRKMAESLNMKKGYDPNAAYGFMIVYYAYTEDVSIDVIERQFVVEDFEGELYRRVERKQRN